MTRRLDPNRLRALRTQRGLTQWDLALRAGVSIGTVTEAERNRTRVPRPKTLRAFAKALGCTVADLLTVSGDNQARPAPPAPPHQPPEGIGWQRGEPSCAPRHGDEPRTPRPVSAGLESLSDLGGEDANKEDTKAPGP